MKRPTTVKRWVLVTTGALGVALACAGGYGLAGLVAPASWAQVGITKPGAGRAAVPSARGYNRTDRRPSPGRRRHGAGSPGAGWLAPGGPVFVGVAVNGAIAPAVRSFAQVTGAHIALVELYTPFPGPFPSWPAGQVTALGSTPLIQWDPRRAPLGAIAAGRYDDYVRRYAAQVRAFGQHVVLSFGHEFNGAWSPWGFLHDTPAQFVGAWRRIHDIFARQGVTNVTWSWDPSHTGRSPGPWWPGPGYVDEIGIDGYQRPGQTFAQIFANRLADIRTFASEPIFIAETSVAPSAGQAAQVAGLFNGVRLYHLLGFVWFDINRLEAWRLEGRPAAISAFRSFVART